MMPQEETATKRTPCGYLHGGFQFMETVTSGDLLGGTGGDEKSIGAKVGHGER
jgi:hypothetical protein